MSKSRIPKTEHRHISLDEYITLANYLPLSNDMDEYMAVREIVGKIDSCPGCRIKYNAHEKIHRGVKQMAKDLAGFEETVEEVSAADVNLGSILLKVSQWLNDLGMSVADAIETQLSLSARQRGYYGELAMATRGEDVITSDAGITFEQSAPGSYLFKIEEDIVFCLEISDDLLNTAEQIAIIRLCDNNMFEPKLLPVDMINNHLVTDDVNLSAGEYCLFLVKHNEEKRGNAVI